MLDLNASFFSLKCSVSPPKIKSLKCSDTHNAHYTEPAFFVNFVLTGCYLQQKRVSGITDFSSASTPKNASIMYKILKYWHKKKKKKREKHSMERHMNLGSLFK